MFPSPRFTPPYPYIPFDALQLCSPLSSLLVCICARSLPATRCLLRNSSGGSPYSTCPALLRHLLSSPFLVSSLSSPLFIPITPLHRPLPSLFPSTLFIHISPHPHFYSSLPLFIPMYPFTTFHVHLPSPASTHCSLSLLSPPTLSITTYGVHPYLSFPCTYPLHLQVLFPSPHTLSSPSYLPYLLSVTSSFTLSILTYHFQPYLLSPSTPMLFNLTYSLHHHPHSLPHLHPTSFLSSQIQTIFSFHVYPVHPHPPLHPIYPSSHPPSPSSSILTIT